MDELQIAISQAVQLYRLYHSDVYSTFDGSHDPRFFSGKLDKGTIQRARLNSMPVKLACMRAAATNRSYETVLQEVQLEVMRQLARILGKDDATDPVVAGLREVVLIDQDEDEVCGVCQEKMCCGEELRAVGCGHMFHRFCIEQWVVRKTNCPLCRYHILVEGEDLELDLNH